MPNCKKISNLTTSIGMNHLHLDEPGLRGLFWCVTSTPREAQMYELPTTRDMKQVSHFKDLVSVGPFTLEYLFFFSYRK